jgi:hypothetical protein
VKAKGCACGRVEELVRENEALRREVDALCDKLQTKEARFAEHNARTKDLIARLTWAGKEIERLKRARA